MDCRSRAERSERRRDGCQTENSHGILDAIGKEKSMAGVGHADEIRGFPLEARCGELGWLEKAR